MATRIKARLDMPPAEAVEYFGAKGDRLIYDYSDLWREQNAHAFGVAKATTADVLRTIRTEVETAIGKGQTFEEFKRRLRPRLEELGWWGRKEVLDGNTGELTTTQLGSDRRLRTIYQTNVQTAYMAGRYKRYLANVDDRPYWRYVAIMDGRTRPTHAALHGKVWRWDDPIWKIIWPPNGWGCRCTVVALTEAEFKALGIPLENGADAVEEMEVPIGREGKTVKVKGVRYKDEAGRDKIFRPDPGWDYNPGEAWSTFDAGATKSEAVGARPMPAAAAASGASAPRPPASTIRAVDGLDNWVDAGRPDIRAPELPALPLPQLLPAARSTEVASRMVSDAIIGPDQDMRIVKTPVDELAIRPELLPSIEAAALGAERYASLVVPALQNPLEVWLTPYDDGVYRKRYLTLFQGATRLLMMVRHNRDGSLFWELFDLDGDKADRLNRLREGVLLFEKDAG